MEGARRQAWFIAALRFLIKLTLLGQGGFYNFGSRVFLMGTLSTKVRNGLWKGIQLLPLSQRLKARCMLMRWRMSDFEPEWHVLSQLGPNRGTALDIGANRGFYTYQLARYYDKVIAFEPNRPVTEELIAYRNPRIRIVHTGLSNTMGTRKLHLPVGIDGTQYDGWASFDPHNMPDCQSTIERAIPTTTLDSAELEGITFIKLDVEGHEIEVVQGGTRMLQRDRPIVLAEVRRENLALFTEFMNDVGLVLSTAIDGKASDMYLFASRPQYKHGPA